MVVADIDAETGQQTVTEILHDFGTKATFVPADVSSKDSVQALVDTAITAIGRVDVMVNNAWGGGSYSRLERMTDASMRQALRATHTDCDSRMGPA